MPAHPDCRGGRTERNFDRRRQLHGCDERYHDGQARGQRWKGSRSGWRTLVPGLQAAEVLRVLAEHLAPQACAKRKQIRMRQWTLYIIFGTTAKIHVRESKQRELKCKRCTFLVLPPAAGRRAPRILPASRRLSGSPEAPWIAPTRSQPPMTSIVPPTGRPRTPRQSPSTPRLGPTPLPRTSLPPPTLLFHAACPLHPPSH